MEARQTILEQRSRILQIVKMRGPVIPSNINKELNTNILIASAMLSELVEAKQLRASCLKIGGSPLYYAPGQEVQLQKFSNNLGEKHKKAYELLMQKKILMEAMLEPVMRAALKDIKDFAVPLTIRYNEKSLVFWKWHILDDKEVEGLIREQLNLFEEKGNALKEIKEKVEEKKIEQKTEKIEEKRIEEKKQEKIKEPEEIKKEVQKELKKEAPEKQIEKISKREEKELKKAVEGSFLETLDDFFRQNKIKIIEHKKIKKEEEIDFILELPSAFGSLKYFCKARNKKKISDSDLASAFLQGQLKKLPVILITNGEPTKKALEMLNTDFKGMTIKKI